MNVDKDAAAAGYRMWVAVIGQIVLSHALALIVTWALVLQGQEIPWPRLLLAVGMAGLLGAALTFNVHRAISLVYWVLARLNRALPAAETQVQRLDPLAPLLSQLNDLIRRDVTGLRETLILKTREAATQEERNRLARELHDSIKQQLFSINVSAAAAAERWTKDPAGAQTALGDVQQSAKEALVEMDSLIQQLAPAPLERVGLAQALREQAESLGYRTGAEVTVELGELPADERLPIGAQEAVFRMAQEALGNVARHARARHVTLRLHERDEVLMLEVTDDGQGFDPAHAPTGGMGLSGLRDRARSLGGGMTVSSAPGQGTQVAVSISLVDTLETAAADKIDHTYNKLFAVGLGGGLALVAALYYPLYVWLPDQFIAHWAQHGTPFPSAEPTLAMLFALLAAAIVVATGWLASRWLKAGSRPAMILWGALAGLIAAIVAFVGIGAGAAGVVGSGALLAHGFRPAETEALFIQLTIDSVLGIIAWNYRVLWGALLAGAGLGALGGLLSNPTASALNPDNLRRGARWLLGTLLAGASLAISLHVGIYAQAEASVRETIANTHASPALPSDIVSLLPVTSAVIAFLVALAALYGIQRSDARSGDIRRLITARTSGLLFGIWPAITISFVWWISPAASLQSSAVPVMQAGAAAGLLLGCLSVVEALRAERHLVHLSVTRHLRVRVAGTILTILLFAVVMLFLLLPALNGQGRGILNNVAMDLGVRPTIGYTFSSGYIVFDSYPFVRLIFGLIGLWLVWWLGVRSLLKSQLAQEGPGLRPAYRVRQTIAGALLGILMIASLSTALPSTAGWPLVMIRSAFGGRFFEQRGIQTEWDGNDWGMLWPVSYYGPGVTDPIDAIVNSILARDEGFPLTVETLREQIAQSWSDDVRRIKGMYTEPANLPVGLFIASLVLAGLIWLGVVGIDALVWRRARELSERPAGRWKAPNAR